MNSFSLQCLVLGLLGALHCLGMCGPLVAALPLSRRRGPAGLNWADFALLQLGRIGTYAVIGALMGLLGQRLSLGSSQRLLCLLSGLVILVVLLTPAPLASRLGRAFDTSRLGRILRGTLSRLMNRPSPAAWVALGALQGLLPCGLVYAAAATATATGEPAAAATAMALFGLANAPALAAAAAAARQLLGSSQLLQRLRPLVPVFIGCCAVLLIVRSCALGIPYLSPAADKTTDAPSCPHCHQAPPTSSL